MFGDVFANDMNSLTTHNRVGMDSRSILSQFCGWEVESPPGSDDHAVLFVGLGTGSPFVYWMIE